MVQNEDKRREHLAIRERVGYYDFTHQLLEVTGKDAGVFLDRLFVNSFSNAKIGRAKYTTMLNDEGVIIDDVIIFRMDEEKFWISTLFIDDMIKHFDEKKEDEDVSYKDITDQVAMYAVQGPKSRDVLNKILDESIDDLKHFRIEDNAIDGEKVKIARSGFTGELGYEVYIPPSKKDALEEKLEAAGEEFDIVSMETDVILTSLPREKGYVLMTDLEGLNPIEAGYGWTIAWKTDFVGKEALEKVKEEGAKRSLIGFEMDEEAEIEPGDPVEKDGEKVGKVTFYCYGYTVEKYIGFAVVDCDKAEIGDEVSVKGKPAKLVDRVFYDPENERVKM